HLDDDVSLLSVIGTRLGMTEITAALLSVLEQVNVNVLAAEHASEERISFSMKKSDLSRALETLHRELRLAEPEAQAFPVQSVNVDAAFWEQAAEPRTANAD